MSRWKDVAESQIFKIAVKCSSEKAVFTYASNFRGFFRFFSFTNSRIKVKKKLFINITSFWPLSWEHC